MNIPHKHAEFIKAWADGEKIEGCFRVSAGYIWMDVLYPVWDITRTYRIKPERVFPTSSLSPQSLFDLYVTGLNGNNAQSILVTKQIGLALKAVADSIIKQHILDTESGK